MAKRKSLNRRSGRFSRASTDSRILDPDTRILGEEEPYWWRHLEDNTVRRSTISNLANETSPLLDSTYRLESSKSNHEWWKMLDASDATNGERTIQHDKQVSHAEDNNDDSQDSEDDTERIKKRKLPLRASARKGNKGNAFLKALNTSKESIVSMPLPKTLGGHFNDTAMSENAVQGRMSRSRKSMDSKTNYSQSMEDVVKLKPKLIIKRRSCKSRNMFDDVLKEHAMDTPRKLSLRRSRTAELQEGNEDNESIIMGQPRASTFGLSFDNTDSETSNALIPKAQSTMLESTSVQMNLSDSSISEQNVLKLKPKVLKWTAKSAQSNNFQDILESEGQGDLDVAEGSTQKSDLLKQKSQHKQSLVDIPNSSIRTSTAISSKRLSTSVQNRQKASLPAAENDTSQSDANESDDSSMSHSRVNAAYKPKSKFLDAWKKTNQQGDTSKKHTTLVEEFGANDGEPIIDIEDAAHKSDTELFDAALRKSVESIDEESDDPAEYLHSRNDAVSKQFQQTGNKSGNTATSHLENSATFNQLNLLSKKSKSSLSKSQKSMTHTIRKSFNIQDDKPTESTDHRVATPEIRIQNEIDRSRKDVHDQSANFDEPDDDDDDDDDKLQQSTRRSTHSKSSSNRTSQITSSARVVPDDITRKENVQVAGRTMERSLHSVTTTSLLNSILEDNTDKEDDQTIGQSTHKQLSHRISSSPVRKSSKIRTTTAAENDSYYDDNEVIRHSTRRSEYNKSLSRRISDSPASKVVKTKTKTKLLPASDTDDEIDENQRRSLRTSRRERSSRLTESTSKASGTQVSTIAEDDSHDEDDQVMRQSTRHTSYNKSSSRRISDSPSKASKSKATLSPASNTDDEIGNKRRSSRSSRRERSSRRIIDSPSSRASRTKVSIIAEDDTQEDDEVFRQNTRRSEYNKSSSRRISDSPHLQLSKTKTPLLPENDTDDAIHENKRRSLRSSTREKSSRGVTESSTSRASRTKISTIGEEDVEFIGQSTRRSTRNKSSTIIDQNDLDEEDPVSINEVPAGTQSISKSRKAESMIPVDGQENRPRNNKTGSNMHNKSASLHISQNPVENMTKEKLTVSDEDDDDEATETFRLVTSRQGRSSTTSEAVENNSSSYIFKARKCKSGASYKEDADLYAKKDNEQTENRLHGNVRNKSVSLRKRSNRNFSTSQVRLSTSNEDHVGETNASTSKTMRHSTSLRTMPKERRSKRISKVSKARTTEKSINESHTAKVQKDGDPSVRLAPPITSSPPSNTSKHRLKVSSDSENTDDEIIFKTRKEKPTIQSTEQKRRSAVPSISDDEQIIEVNEIHDIEAIVDANVMNPPSRRSLHPATGRNRGTKSTSNLKNVHSTQDNVSEDEQQDTGKSGATVASSLEMAGEVRDMSSINISNITRRSPLLSSTRRSIFPNAPNKRGSKFSSPPSSKYSALDNMPTSPINHPMEDDFAEEENERSPVRISAVSGSDQKKFSDGSRKSSHISQVRASTSLAKKGDETRQTGHRFHRVNNTIPEETSASYEDPVPNTTEKEQSTRNQRPITKQQNKTNEDIEKSTTFKKPQEHSEIGTQLENSTIDSMFTKNKTIVEDARSKKTPGKSVITERTLGNVSKQKESGTQRSMMDFLQGRMQKGFNRTIFSTQSDSQSQQSSAAVVLSDPHKVEEIKKKIVEIVREEEMVSVRKKAELSPVKKLKLTKDLTGHKKPRPTKAVNSAYLVRGKIYKPPPLSRPKYWVTNRLYQYLEKCLLPKYDISTRVRSEKFIKYLVTVTTLVKKRKKYDNYKDDVDHLMKHMAHLGIIKNRRDFYHFCYNFLPYEIRAKLIPITLPGNKQTIPYDPKLLYVPLLNT